MLLRRKTKKKTAAAAAATQTRIELNAKDKTRAAVPRTAITQKLDFASERDRKTGATAERVGTPALQCRRKRQKKQTKVPGEARASDEAVSEAHNEKVNWKVQVAKQGPSRTRSTQVRVTQKRTLEMPIADVTKTLAHSNTLPKRVIVV